MSDQERGGAGPGGIFAAMQQMQEKVQAIQARLAGQTVEGQAGGGMVTAVANGRLQIVALRVEPDLCDPAQREMLQDLAVAAVNDALRRAQELAAREMGQLAGALGLDPGAIR